MTNYTECISNDVDTLLMKVTPLLGSMNTDEEYYNELEELQQGLTHFNVQYATMENNKLLQKLGTINKR